MKITKKHIVGLCLFSVLIFSFYFFGIVGVKTILITLLLFFVPTYAIINNFDLGQDEKIFFSFFIGLGLFPLVVWYINRIIVSLKVSLIITLLLLVLIGLLLRIKFKKN